MIMMFTGCQEGANQTEPQKLKSTKIKQDQKRKMPSIEKTMRLPKSLDEISGLTFDASANVLIGHNDELGVLYNIDFESNKIDSEIKISDLGDYEGVELVGNKVYLINSGGDIFEHVVGESGSVKKATGLNANNNVEGLAYTDGQLLIACKGFPEKNSFQKFTGCRAIYSYSLSTSQLGKFPFMLISYAMLRANFIEEPSPTEIQRLKEFAPSGIAIHPATNDIYILSHMGRLLVVSDASANIKNIYFLDEQDHLQAEGICFDTKNRMYIANEGAGGTPVIHRYQF